uniref:Uncharacterized protein n=1 Tax=Tetranychus urticae TaxID=32264 RepID=A0A158P4E6_TETUR
MFNEYFVDLVSIASMDIFPGNTISKFVNRLPSTLHLDGDWMVAVQEIFYPTAHKPLKRNITYSISYRGLRPLRKLNFTYSEGDSIEVIISKLNDHIKIAYNRDNLIDDDDGVTTNQKAGFIAPKFEMRKIKEKDREKEKCVMHGGFIPESPKPIIPLFQDQSFLRILGFDTNTLEKDYEALQKGRTKEIIASYQPETGPNAHLMFIYTDLIDDHFVGDVSARVLRVVPLDKQSKNTLAHVTFNNPYYYPVRSNNIEDISILLCDETGQQIRFKSGRVFLSLHFKRKTVV